MEKQLDTTIAIVDDTPNVRLLLRQYLNELGIRNVREFGSAEDFFEAFASFESRLDSILMDVRLPGKDGIEATRRLKSKDRYETLPVLAVTGESDADILRRAFDAGCMDYLTKPIKKPELHARVKSALELKQTLDELEARNRELRETKKKLERANEKLENQAREDGLTGIANKRAFNERLKKEWERGAREKTKLSLVMCDIDYFKAFNDNYGHERGDSILVRIADVIDGAAMRPADLAARYGGEEFAAILPKTDLSGATKVAQRIKKSVADLNIEHGAIDDIGYVTVSCGVATVVPQQSCPPERLVKRADRAMYRAKENGRNQVCPIPPSHTFE